MGIITISRQIGSHGTEIANRLAEQTGYHLIDKEYIYNMLSQYGVSENHIDKIYYQKKLTIFDFFSSKEKYREVIKLLVYEFAKKGNVVIIGLGAQLHLKDLHDVLRLRFIAPYKIRVEREKLVHNCNLDNAERIIEESDHARANFNSILFDFDWESETTYDLIINTQKLPIDAAIEVINTRLRFIKEAGDQESSQLLDNLILSQKVLINIFFNHKIPVRFYQIDSKNGIVQLKCSVNHADEKELCIKAASEVEGVQKVEADIDLAQYNDQS